MTNRNETEKPTLLIDRALHRPLRFSSAVAVERCDLSIGHYSVRGSSRHVAIDYLDSEEFVQLVTREQERLVERCQRMTACDVRAIVVGAPPHARNAGRFGALVGRSVPTIWAGTLCGATRTVERMLTLVWLQQRQRAGIGPALPFITGGTRPHVVTYDQNPDEEPPVPLGAA